VNSPYTLAFDFGGTKLTAGLVNLHNGEIISQIQGQTPVEQGSQGSLQFMEQIGRRLMEQNALEVGAIGISFGGPLSKDRRVILRSHHVRHWENFPLPQALSDIFQLPAFMDNDANAAALGEWVFGIGAKAETMVYVQVSTGIGAGIISNQQVYRGSGLAGEFGHITILPGGAMCSCGKRGCLESLVSGWAIAREGKNVIQSGKGDPILQQACMDNRDAIVAETIFTACRAGSPAARLIIEDAISSLGMGIANVICLIDPQVIVVGGGVARSWDVIYPILIQSIHNNLPPILQNRTSLRHAACNGTETLLGAALLPLGY